jgi:ABC-type nitrate/sulfonate/bicarbonate transport system substrate-binding protein
VIARSDWAARESKTIRDFMAALNRATALMSKDPEAAVEAIEEITVVIPHAELEAQAKATAPLLSTGN